VKLYRVKWEIDVEANTAREAAEFVWDQYIGPNGELGTATVLDVHNGDSCGEEWLCKFDMEEGE